MYELSELGTTCVCAEPRDIVLGVSVACYRDDGGLRPMPLCGVCAGGGMTHWCRECS